MSYRSDVEALEIKLAELERDRAEVARDHARLVDSARRLGDVTAELDRVRRELHARAPRKLPLLDDLRVASPCPASWDAMVGDEQSRFCAGCQKHVYNLSAMTREAAEALVRSKEGDLCVRYYRRADGTVLTADCPVGVRRKRVRLVAAAGAVTALAAGAAAMAFARSTPPDPPPPPLTTWVQGGASEQPVAPVSPVVTAPQEMIGQAIQGGISPMPREAPPPPRRPTTHRRR